MTQPQSVVDLADDDDNNADAVTAELQGYFSRSRTWECEKTLGHGAYGTAILVKERSGRDGRQRRVVLKRALGDGIAELKAEIATLEKLRGGAHFTTLLASCDDPTEFADPGPSESTFETIFTSLHGLRGPALVQEYYQNGTISSLQEKAKAQNIDIPNRLLWHFYLCPYPPTSPESGIERLEEIPSDRTAGDRGARGHRGAEHGNRRHGPEHAGAQHDPDSQDDRFREQPGVRRGGERGGGEPALCCGGKPPCCISEPRSIVANKVEQEMLRMIRKGPVQTRVLRNATYFEGVRTVATDILPGVDGVLRFPNLDPKLRDLLVQALRTDRGRRPTLAEMLAATQNGWQSWANDTQDPDTVTIQRLIYDAS
ncbi:hypothetical protein CIB48_g11307 [Xylaria polymorpha]|nr:hypothetical protein CIB48_g11307 [Xylaria polymorpha]